MPDENRYVSRQQLLEQACGQENPEPGTRAALSLDGLIAAMKEGSKADDYLACLYFAGADVDHPFFLKNDAVAIGVSVLPQDAAKAGLRKRHPHQVEVIFVLKGQVRLYLEQDGRMQPKTVQQGEHYVIGKNKCHWIEPENSGDAAYLFVKTNPDVPPRSTPCDLSE